MAESVELPLFFVGAEDTPILFANLMVVQQQHKEFILTFGQFTPPLVLGTTAEQVEQAKSMPYVPVKVVARIGMTPERMSELIGILQDNYNRFVGKRGDEE